MVKTEIVVGAELPYRVQIDALHGAGITPSGAVMAALSAGGAIPAGIRDRRAAASHIFRNYKPTPDWKILVDILEHDCFHTEASSPDAAPGV